MARLGELEHAIMDVLWSAPRPQTAREVRDALTERDLAATTILTVLSRLEGKGLVERDRSNRAHRYRPTAERDVHVAGLMRQALDSAPDATAALARFADAVTPSEAAALTEALEEAMKRRAEGE
ncbi:MAG TPA: BlaI/MecI/CopY family transcriptional regulator [Stackebrandtia sp.]|uniref:BlaI/MecI/CopY family transcriptional regulator n=1 Tax=Stackebrandtia sp. TaxID=2023065 RepID=UPI002D4EF2AC|nr:BlaI/MecI/CopY family transcriptional regulator [Stackebrandtia sp.]HZE41834.1 BlaI/MecI/CopY family transcriptional regulator [Stackebrandtia sp.]